MRSGCASWRHNPGPRCTIIPAFGPSISWLDLGQRWACHMLLLLPPAKRMFESESLTRILLLIAAMSLCWSAFCLPEDRVNVDFAGVCGESSQVRSVLEETDEDGTVLNKLTRTLLLMSLCWSEFWIHIAVHECVSVLLNRSELVSRPSIGAGQSCL